MAAPLPVTGVAQGADFSNLSTIIPLVKQGGLAGIEKAGNLSSLLRVVKQATDAFLGGRATQDQKDLLEALYPKARAARLFRDLHTASALDAEQLVLVNEELWGHLSRYNGAAKAKEAGVIL